MTHVEGEILIRRSPEDVFNFVADERNEPRYNPRMVSAEMITTGPIGTGTRFRAVMKTIGRPEMVTEFAGYERPSRLALVTHMSAMEIEGALTFDAAPEGTRMRWSWQLAPRGIWKLMTPLVARIGRRQEAAIWATLKSFSKRNLLRQRSKRRAAAARRARAAPARRSAPSSRAVRRAGRSSARRRAAAAARARARARSPGRASRPRARPGRITGIRSCTGATSSFGGW